MRHSFYRTLILAVGALLLPVAASAQVLTFATQFTGEVPAADEKLFREALASEAAAVWKGNAKNEAATAALLGSGATCAEASCAAAAGAAVPASAAIFARVNDEAEIFDFTVSVFSAVDGKLLVKESGECTFCSMQEASAAFRATAKTALGKVGTLPTATAGKVVAPAPVAVAPTPVSPVVAAPFVAAPAPAPKPAPVVVAPAPAPKPAPVVAAPAPAPKPAAVAAAPAPKPAAEPERLDAWMKGDKAVSIAATPATASVQVNGQIVGTGTASIKAAPQKLELTVVAPGYTTYTERLELLSAAPGLDLRIALASESAGGVDLETRQFRRSAGWVSTSLGIIGAITGAALLARDGEPNCAGAASQCAEVYDLGAAGAMLTTLGGIAFGSGVTLLFATPAEP